VSYWLQEGVFRALSGKSLELLNTGHLNTHEILFQSSLGGGHRPLKLHRALTLGVLELIPYWTEGS
jgi:hypothetical protein